MEKKLIKYLCAVCIVFQALSLSACGGASSGNSSTGSSTPSDNNPPGPPPPPAKSSPTVSITPTENTKDVPYMSDIKLKFSESVNNVNTYTVTLHVDTKSGESVPLKLIGSESNDVYLFKPKDALTSDTRYTVVVSSNITSVAKNESVADTTSSFITMKNHYAYVTDLGETTLTVCIEDSNTGELSQCKDTGNGFNRAYGVAVDPEFKHAYVANESGLISICDINKIDGTLANCNGYADKNIPLASGLTIDPLGNNLYIGINQPNSKVTKCSINKTDGSLSNCMYLSFQDIGEYTANDISISKDGKFAYISAYYQSIISCPINVDGSFISQECQRETSSEYFTDPIGVTVNPLIESGIFVINLEHANATACSFLDGEANYSCDGTGGGFSFPAGIALDLYSKFAYVTNSGNGTVSVCLVSADSSLGSLDNCASENGGGKFSTPNLITVY